jgi:hypothetical protein
MYHFDEESLYWESTCYDDEDSFIIKEDNYSVLYAPYDTTHPMRNGPRSSTMESVGSFFDTKGTPLIPGSETVETGSSEPMKDVPPVPQTDFDGCEIHVEDENNMEIEGKGAAVSIPQVVIAHPVVQEGDKVLVGRSRPIGHRPRASFSPIRPP